MKTTLSGKWAFDSNIFIYSQDHTSPFYEPAKALFAQALSGSFDMVCAQQNILESENVLIKVYRRRPSEVSELMMAICSNFSIHIVAPSLSTLDLFHTLFSRSTGVPDIYDIYLAATLLDNGVTQLLTANVKDFVDIDELHVVNPFV